MLLAFLILLEKSWTSQEFSFHKMKLNIFLKNYFYCFE